MVASMFNEYKSLQLKSAAFSLIELMVAIAIIAVISVVGVASYQKYQTKSKVASLARVGDSIAQRSMEYYSTHGVYPTAAQLGYSTAADGKTITNPQSISPYLSNLYISGSVTDGNSSSNPMGYAVLTLNGASFPNDMATGTNPGFLAYSFGQQAGSDTNPFTVGCETAFSIDNLAGASGNYSYVTCPSGVPYSGGTGSGGADLPQVCAGCGLSAVLADATGSSGYLGAYSGGGGSGGGGGGPWQSCTHCPTYHDYTVGCTTTNCTNAGNFVNHWIGYTPQIVEFAQANGFYPNASQLNLGTGSRIGVSHSPSTSSGGFLGFPYFNEGYSSTISPPSNIADNLAIIGIGNGTTGLMNYTWYDGSAYRSACVIPGAPAPSDVPPNCVTTQINSNGNKIQNPDYVTLTNSIFTTAQPPQ